MEPILVVDDNPNIVKLIQVNLEFEGYSTLVAYDGRDALSKAKISHPSLLILDILMPYLNGWQVLETLKKDPQTADIPVIVLTAMGQKEDQKRGWELGVTDYITKPFNPMRLLEVVNRILRPPIESEFSAPIETKPVTRVAIVGGSRRATAILQTLLGNSRIQILGVSAQSRDSIAKLARELKIFVTTDPYELCTLPDVELLIETEPHTLDPEKIRERNPAIEVLRGYSSTFMWGLVEEKEASEERARSLVKELHMKVKELNALHEAGKMIGSVMDLEVILLYVLNLMSDLVNAESGVLFMEQNGEFVQRTSRGNVPFPIHAPPSLLRMAFRTGKPVIVSGVAADIPGVQAILVPLGTKDKVPSALSYSLAREPSASGSGTASPKGGGSSTRSHRNKVLGFAALIFNHNVEISEGDRTFLATLAAQAGIAIENAKLFEDATESKRQVEALLSKLIYAQEEERKRISAEIHDSIAQSLVSAHTKVQTIQAVFEKSTEGAQPDLEDLKKLLFESIREVRQIIFNLRPSTLDDLGLVPTLEHFIKKFELENKKRIAFTARFEKRRLPPVVETAVYRIVQEALTNIKKHSGADEVEIKLEGINGKLILQISDNGKGFDREAVRESEVRGESVGITGMMERAALLGGTFKIDSVPGKGTQVFVEVPIRWKEKN